MKAGARTDTILDRILVAKEEEVASDERIVSRDVMRRRADEAAKAGPADAARGLAARLSSSDTVAVIAEVKRKSPSKGRLAERIDAPALASAYARGGAGAVSVLTDEPFFGGGAEDLQTVRAAVPLPVLRKDFIIDEYQIDEAKVWGADAVLLIVAALDDARLTELLGRADELALDALVEVHTEEELGRALQAGARLVGVNNRDLRTFETTLDVSLRLAEHVPPDVVLVSESGIRSRHDVVTLAAAGFDGILVGESFVKSSDPEAAVARLAGVPGRNLRTDDKESPGG